MEWFPRQEDPPVILKPKKLLKRGLDTKVISGPKTSTQTESSQKELLKELLDLITTMSDERWKTRQTLDDLDISLTSSTSSSSSEDSSSQSSFEDDPPPTPPNGGDATTSGGTTHPPSK
nr:ORF3 [Torque teno felis virus]